MLHFITFLAGAAALVAAGAWWLRRVCQAERWDLPAAILQILAFAATVVAVLALLVVAAFAQDGHSRWHHWYQHWRQPGTTTSCCNARQTGPLGVETGDCEPTRAEIRAGTWYAWERHLQTWLPIPEAKIIRERNPSTEEAHLCWTPASGVLCFVPPDTGG